MKCAKCDHQPTYLYGIDDTSMSLASKSVIFLFRNSGILGNFNKANPVASSPKFKSINIVTNIRPKAVKLTFDRTHLPFNRKIRLHSCLEYDCTNDT